MKKTLTFPCLLLFVYIHVCLFFFLTHASISEAPMESGLKSIFGYIYFNLISSLISICSRL